jgi:S1-C subfamily serine protease
LRIRTGDIIVKINNRDVKNVRELQRLLRGADQWALVLRRGDQLLSFSVRA